jgi:hypothetical protein
MRRAPQDDGGVFCNVANTETTRGGSIRYLVSAGSGFTLSSGMPACMVISVIDTRS